MADSEKSEHDKVKGRKHAKKKPGSKPTTDKSSTGTTKQESKDKVNQLSKATCGDAVESETKEDTVKTQEEVASIPDRKDEKKETDVEDTTKDADVLRGISEEKSGKTDSGKNEKNSSEVAEKGDDTNQKSELLGDEKDKADTMSSLTPKSQDIPRSRDHTAEQDKVLDELSGVAEESGSWGWGKSLLKTASLSVTTFTEHVGLGFNTFVETIETGLGVPPPEAMAGNSSEVWDTEGTDDDKNPATEQPHETTKPTDSELASTKEAKPETRTASKNETGKSEEEKADDTSSGWFASWGVGELTSKIQTKGKSFISGSLDAVEAVATGGLNVLETIGKKTIDVLNDHDPEFKRTKNVLFHKKDKINLSQVLREAKDRAEHQSEQDQEVEEARKANFGAVFDEFQGLAHLEALEILSNQSEKKVQVLLAGMSDETVAALKPQLVKMKNTFELEDNDDDEQLEHEFSKSVTEHLTELHLGTTPDKLNKAQEKIRQWITEFYTKDEAGTKTEPKDIHQCAIQSLAEISAKAVEQFHKAGELLLLQKDSDKSCYERGKSLASFTQVLCTEIGILSTKFSQCLNKAAEDIEDSSLVTPMVTNVFLEASNSSTYIQDAFCLLLPVLQQAEIQNSQIT